MAATRTTLKQYFKKYATPTEEQFAALIDAFVHKDEDSLTQSKIDGLTAALESKVSSSDLASAVATAVEETLQGGNVEVTPAAHEHAIDDVEGLQAFVTKVNNFLESADVSDETINRWAEIETFLTGVTDQETLAGLLLNLKNEILAQIPEPQTGNYLKQISDLDAYTDAQEGEIVQYVGTSTADYTRGFCYERVAGATYVLSGSGLTLTISDNEYGIKPGIYYNTEEILEEHVSAWSLTSNQGCTDATILKYVNINGDAIRVLLGGLSDYVVITDSHPAEPGVKGAANIGRVGGYSGPITITPSSWQPIITSPVVS